MTGGVKRYTFINFSQACQYVYNTPTFLDNRIR